MTYSKQARIAELKALCPHCEFDRQFPGFEKGGWIQQDNNGPIVACPVCNPDGDKESAFERAWNAARDIRPWVKR